LADGRSAKVLSLLDQMLSRARRPVNNLAAKLQQAYNKGFTRGYRDGFTKGFKGGGNNNQAFERGYQDGFRIGFEDGRSASRAGNNRIMSNRNGREDDYSRGFAKGYSEGFDRGYKSKR
jgi:flagellar biosynthesis/type III secretory pathway protein FliH